MPFSIALLVAAMAASVGEATHKDGRVEPDVAYAEEDELQKLDLYHPKQDRFTTIVFTYGGGWHSGSRKSVAPIGEKLQSLGFGCALISHRLSPKHHFPAQAEDLAAAFAWVKKNIEAKGGDPRRVVLMGHSSGAHLSLLVATDVRYLARYNLAPSEIAGVVGLSTPLDLEPRDDKRGFGDALMAGKGADVFSRDPAVMKSASPIQYVSHELPSTLLVVGERDFPMLEKDAATFAEKARKVDRDVVTFVAKGSDHLGVVRSLLEDKSPVQEQVVAFLAKVGELREAPEVREIRAGDADGLFSIDGLPQHSYSMNVEYEQGVIVPLRCLGTVGFIIKPKTVDPGRRWIWDSNLFLAVNWTDAGAVVHRYLVEKALARGFHVVGIDVGASLGSPAGAEVYQKFYEIVRDRYGLNRRVRMIGHSNGGLITLGWAFRHPEQVDRVLGIFPATDLRSWPGLERVAGPGRITPAGLAYDLDSDGLRARLKEFNPIDNLEPLAKAGVKIYHIHGTADDVVPIGPNSVELARRYRELGGNIELETVEGGKHGGPEFYRSEKALLFLLE